VVVFSNGPDNASVIAPDDVRAVAENEGIPIYVISADEGNPNAVYAAVFGRLTGRTGGRLYWARTWHELKRASTSIDEDIRRSNVVAYYPR
jgi:hypothetical protein